MPPASAKPLTLALAALICLFLLWDFYRAGEDSNPPPAVHTITTDVGGVIVSDNGAITRLGPSTGAASEPTDGAPGSRVPGTGAAPSAPYAQPPVQAPPLPSP